MALTLGIVGCHSGTRANSAPATRLSAKPVAATQAATTCLDWRPELLYLQSSAYRKLYVEVDAVEGCLPPQEDLDCLRQFLACYCDKPDGIVIKCEKAIPHEEARRRKSYASLRLNAVHGPPADDKDGAWAYLQVFFYNSLVDGSDETWPHCPYAEKFPYACSIAIDRGYARGFQDKLLKLWLTHEAGHILGLVSNPSHGNNGHCTNERCVMSPSLAVSVWSVLTLRDRIVFNEKLCDLCKQDLRQMRQDVSALPRAQFIGPFLVRVEDGYCLMTLPSYQLLWVGPPDLLKRYWREQLARGQAQAGPGQWHVAVDPPASEPERLLAVLERACRDQNGSVRDMATSWAEELRATLAKSRIAEPASRPTTAVATEGTDNGR